MAISDGPIDQSTHILGEATIVTAKVMSVCLCSNAAEYSAAPNQLATAFGLSDSLSLEPKSRVLGDRENPPNANPSQASNGDFAETPVGKDSSADRLSHESTKGKSNKVLNSCGNPVQKMGGQTNDLALNMTILLQEVFLLPCKRGAL